MLAIFIIEKTFPFQYHPIVEAERNQRFLQCSYQVDRKDSQDCMMDIAIASRRQGGD